MAQIRIKETGEKCYTPGMFLHAWHPQPYIFSIGSYHLRWYGLMLAVGALVGVWVMQRLAKRYQLDTGRVFDLTLLLLVAGFIGARLYHVVNEWAYYRLHANEIWAVWNGGLAIHGALIAGFLMLVFLASRWKMNLWILADIAAPAVALGQAIGRWGNYFNQELFGQPTTLAWGIPIDPVNRPAPYLNVAFFHPTFLYESLGSLLIAGALLVLHRRRFTASSAGPRVGQPGAIVLTYFVLYALVRMVVESIRIDRTPIISGVRLPILFSAVLAVIAAVVLFIRYRRTHAST